jgi:XTP/dITP diphosphohydrolase
VKAYRIQEKVRGVGFDWENTEQVWEKVQEEIAEFNREKNENSPKMEDEFGDILFALINYARFVNINPEDALEKTNRKFIQRFNFIEQKAKEQGKPLSEMTLTEMEALWQMAKLHLNSSQ